MVAIFASATALLTPEFVGSFEPEKLAAKFVQVEKETGVKFNKTNSTFNIVGHWDAIQIAHKSLKKLVNTLERAPIPPPDYDHEEPEPEPQKTVAEKTPKSEDAGAAEKVIPIKGNPKRGRYASLDPAKPSSVPDPVVYFQYQDKSYMSEEVLNLDALLDAFEDNLPDTVKVKKEDLKKILEKNTENMGRPLEKRKAYIQAQAELKAKEEEQQRQLQELEQQQQQQELPQLDQPQPHENQLQQGLSQQEMPQQLAISQDQPPQLQHIQHQLHQGLPQQDQPQHLNLSQQDQSQQMQHQLHQGLPQADHPHQHPHQIHQVLPQLSQPQPQLQPQPHPHPHQQPQFQEQAHLNGELAGIPNHHLPVMETTREEIEAIDSAQASIEQALESAVASMGNHVVPSNTMSLPNVVTNVSKSTGALLTPPSVSVNSWTENTFSNSVPVDNAKAEIKDEIPSSDNDFGGDTDDDLSYLDLSHVTGSHVTALPEAEPVTEKPKSPEKPKETAEKPKGKGSKRGRKGKVKKVKDEPQPVEMDTSKEQADQDDSDTENVGKRRSRRKSKPIKYVASDKEGEQGAEQEEAPPPKKKGLRVRKVQVIKNVGQKSKKGKKAEGQDGSTGAGSERKGKRKPPEDSGGNAKSQDDAQKIGRPKSNKVYKCTECDYSSQRRTRWTEHMGRVHGFITERDLERQKQPQFPCDKCDKSFIFEKDLKRHNRIVHTAVSHFCTVCQKTYKSKYVFDKHVATHQDGYVQPMFCCQVCPRSFTTKFMLAHHIKSEHLGIKKTYLCPTCGKSFSQIRSYRQHANVHAGIRPFVCETCGKSFTYEKSLKEHRYMHDNLRRFPCKVCGKAFRQYTCLIIHMKVHKDTKDHICASCGKGFTQKQSLIRHERIHTGDKPYTCAICQKSFSDYAVIRKHMMMCHKQNKDNWKEHIITDVKKPQSNHYISGGPGYVPRDQSTQISDYVKPGDATLVQTANLEPGQPTPHMPGHILPVQMEETDTNSNTNVSETNVRSDEELLRKVTIADEDAQNALSRLSAVYSGANLYSATNLIQSQEIPLTSDMKIQQTSQEQNQITLMPLNYSVSQNYTTGVNVARTELSEEVLANYLKSEMCPSRSQNQKDVYTPILAPLSSVVPVSDSQRSQVAFTTPTSGDSVISQATLSAWGYAGYPAYYTPANFVQYQGQQNS